MIYRKRKKERGKKKKKKKKKKMKQKRRRRRKRKQKKKKKKERAFNKVRTDGFLAEGVRSIMYQWINGLNQGPPFQPKNKNLN